MIRVVIADDEPLARERIRTLVAAHGDLSLVAECGDGEETLRVLLAERPDVVFLDVQMPELNGFEVLEALPAELRPSVIFITAYDEHAVRAFDVNAVDYLLKPVEVRRFEAALAKVRERRGQPPAASQAALEAVLAELRRARGHASRLVVRDGSRVTFVRTEEIDWIDAAGNYARLHVGRAVHLLREPLKVLATRLDPERFLRVHRSAIVNLERITSVEPYFHGEYTLTLKDGTRLTSSRTHSARLRSLLR
ncbi:MAG TPA: LytTR family DNA-binding domain-containing protein [Gemmatimonadales bacterium]|nr:LytTR family DNA-binding domain-containing protein [Gemmatimonadales bacterium]